MTQDLDQRVAAARAAAAAVAADDERRALAAELPALEAEKARHDAERQAVVLEAQRAAREELQQALAELYANHEAWAANVRAHAEAIDQLYKSLPAMQARVRAAMAGMRAVFGVDHYGEQMRAIQANDWRVCAYDWPMPEHWQREHRARLNPLPVILARDFKYA